MKRFFFVDTHLNLPLTLRKLNYLSSTPATTTPDFNNAIEKYFGLVNQLLNNSSTTTTTMTTEISALISVASDKDLFEDNEKLTLFQQQKLTTKSNSSTTTTTTTAKIFDVYGMHPLYCKQYDSTVEEFLVRKLRDDKVIAFGEIGLDFHDFGAEHHTQYASKELQLEVFERQLQLHAQHANQKPLIIHW